MLLSFCIYFLREKTRSYKCQVFISTWLKSYLQIKRIVECTLYIIIFVINNKITLVKFQKRSSQYYKKSKSNLKAEKSRKEKEKNF